MLLQNKIAVVFAASGAIAGQVAMSMAHQGATVCLSSRNLVAINDLARQVQAEGGQAETVQLDALNETAVDAYLSQLIVRYGRIDILFNGIGLKPAEGQYGTPSTELAFEQFMAPFRTHVGSQFLTARLAARYMLQTQTPGTILFLTASLSKIKVPFMAGITAACSAIEGMTRVFATEFGPAGIRVNCLNPSSLYETATIQQTNELSARSFGISSEQLTQMMMQNYMLKRGPSLTEVGQVATFLVSDAASAITGKVIDVDCGHFQA